MSDMFDKAVRLKLRYSTPLGMLSVEDLYDLPLTSTKGKANLDDIAIVLDKELKDSTSTSFVNKATKTNDIARLKFDIVLHVIGVKQAENEAEATRRSNAEKKSKLLELIASKQDESLKGKSVEELQALVNGL